LVAAIPTWSRRSRPRTNHRTSLPSAGRPATATEPRRRRRCSRAARCSSHRARRCGSRRFRSLRGVALCA
jgi:hypothetical protein